MNLIIVGMLLLKLSTSLICSKSEGCTTNEKGNEKGKDCVFPFIYKSIKYDFCTKVEEEDYWCYTEVDSGGKGVDGKWGYCDANCFVTTVVETSTTETTSTSTFTTSTTTTRTSATSIIKTTSFNGTAIAGQTSDNKMNSINTNGIETESTKKRVLTTKSTIKPNPADIDPAPKPTQFGFAVKNQVEAHVMMLSIVSLFLS